MMIEGVWQKGNCPTVLVGTGDAWSKRQVWPWSTKWSRAKTNRVLPKECTGLSKHPLPTTQEMTLHMDITRWLILKSDWLYSLQSKMEKLYTVSKNKTRSWLWLRSWTPYCNSLWNVTRSWTQLSEISTFTFSRIQIIWENI